MFQRGSNNPEDYVFRVCVGHTWNRLHVRFSSVCVGSMVGNDIRETNGMLWKKHTHTHLWAGLCHEEIWKVCSEENMTAKLCSLMCMLKCIYVLLFLCNLDQGGIDHLSQFLQETNTKNKVCGCVFTPDGYIFPCCSALWLTLERLSSRTPGVEGCEKALFHYRQLLQAQAGILSFTNVAKKWKN